MGPKDAAGLRKEAPEKDVIRCMLGAASARCAVCLSVLSPEARGDTQERPDSLPRPRALSRDGQTITTDKSELSQA